MLSLNASTRALLVVAILLSAAACTTRPTAEAVSKFSVALDGTSQAVQQGLSEIQRLETAVNDSSEAEQFVRQADPNIQFGRNTRLTDEVIQPRLAFFKALSSYASSLATAVSDEQIEGVRAQFSATGEEFKKLGEQVASAAGQNFPTDLADQVSTAAAGITAFLVEEKLNREIPVIVSGVHEDLRAGVAAFKADLGDPTTGGFRAIMNDSIQLLIGQKKQFLLILKSKGGMSDADLYEAVLQAQTEVRELQRSERLLAAIPSALDKLVEAHAALQSPKNESTLGRIQIFFERAKELKAIADGLSS